VPGKAMTPSAKISFSLHPIFLHGPAYPNPTMNRVYSKGFAIVTVAGNEPRIPERGLFPFETWFPFAEHGPFGHFLNLLLLSLPH
jgi:hypothetical protein